ncbi:MAG: histidine phosphatase family protein [Spirochaetales bacterium]|nr:histidine phosphatase family protein [Spirochaetales bacterium]
MKTLILQRHAKSSWDYPELEDHERPLNKRGKKASQLIGAFFRQNGIQPDLILCSTAMRTRETLRLMTNEWETVAEIQFIDRIYHGDEDELISIITAVPNQVSKLMVIGHNPTLENLLEDMIGTTAMPEKFSTAAVAFIEVPVDDWREISTKNGTLVQFITPKGLKKGLE